MFTGYDLQDLAAGRVIHKKCGGRPTPLTSAPDPLDVSGDTYNVRPRNRVYRVTGTPPRKVPPYPPGEKQKRPAIGARPPLHRRFAFCLDLVHLVALSFNPAAGHSDRRRLRDFTAPGSVPELGAAFVLTAATRLTTFPIEARVLGDTGPCWMCGKAGTYSADPGPGFPFWFPGAIL